MKRRKFLHMVGTGMLALLTLPSFAKGWPKEAFLKTKSADAINQLYPGLQAEESDKISMKVPEIAENGAVVPVTVSSDLADVTNITILIDENPNPLAASFDLGPNSIPEISVRMKMGKTSVVTALVAAGGKLFSVKQEVKVTIGGCGG